MSCACASGSRSLSEFIPTPTADAFTYHEDGLWALVKDDDAI